MENENFFTTQEIAELLGVSPSSIQRWADSGKLKCHVTEGGHRKFSRTHLSDFATTYNISMKFLDTTQLRSSFREENNYTPIAAAR
ncbi:MAG: helix-turn-helix domain-containing protein [Bacteroidota bacterium]|jgi:excisionase family DNA binding protein